MNFNTWLKGILSAGIGGFANAIVLMIADPLTFNFDEGFNKVITVAVVSAVVAVAMYLKQSPLPDNKP